MADSPTSSIEELLRAYFVRDLGVSPAPGDDDELAARGFIASAQLLELVDFVEATFAVVLKPIDVLPENLASIATIARTVRTRLGERK